MNYTRATFFAKGRFAVEVVTTSEPHEPQEGYTLIEVSQDVTILEIIHTIKHIQDALYCVDGAAFESIQVEDSGDHWDIFATFTKE